MLSPKSFQMCLKVGIDEHPKEFGFSTGNTAPEVAVARLLGSISKVSKCIHNSMCMMPKSSKSSNNYGPRPLLHKIVEFAPRQF